jgi:hypothetical protein
MSTRKNLNKKRGMSSVRRWRTMIAIAVGVSVIGGWTLLAYPNAPHPPSNQKETKDGTVAVASFNPANPSKEFVHAGTKLISTEEPESCTPLLTTTYKSFAATPGTSADNPSGGTISFTLGSSCSWTATTNASWITFTSATSGTGSGSVTYSVAVNGSGVPRSGTITIGGQTYMVYQGQEFTDVPTSHLFYAFIGRLASRGVTNGCSSSTYCPDSAVLHEQMAGFVIRALGMPNPPAPPSQRFSDVPPSNFFYAFIEQMAVRGIWTGCGGGTYCPTAAVKREEMAAIMIRGRGEI